MKDSSISHARRRIEQQIEVQEQERKRRMYSQRLEMARAGISAYQGHKFVEAANYFQNYIRVLEEVKDVGPGKLHPRLFDSKEDSNELLMISGVYWDLVKLYDRTKSKEKLREFRHYLEQYLQFSKGQPFQHLCAEALRKYLSGDKALHREEFKHAYRALSVNQCFIATALEEEVKPETLIRLRSFRDQVLLQHAVGKGFVRTYYRIGPGLARVVDRLPGLARKGLASTLDCLAHYMSKVPIRPGRKSTLNSEG